MAVLPQSPPPESDTDSNEPRRDRSGKASKWVSVGRNGREQLSTRSRLYIVLVVWSLGWFSFASAPDDLMPSPDIQRSTVVQFAFVAVLIALFHASRGPWVRGRSRLVWDGLTVAFSAALLIVALMTGYERGWH